MSHIGAPKIDNRCVLALHNAVLILLNRPFLHRRMLDGEEGMQSWRAALDTIELARIYDDRFTLRKAPITMSQVRISTARRFTDY